LEQYFGIPYPYDKSDQLAVPVSFGGAMENPGLVTYDADIILSPPGQDTDARQRKYAEIAAHELAHQWFGDMVTMAWWNDVWLNESFATWMSARLIADWKPEWKTRSEDQTERLRAIGADMVTSARRINQPAESKNDIGDAFDYITYQKGGSVLAMFENAVGPEKFQRGVHAYLNDHLFGNARAEDFLEAIGRASSPEYAAAFSTFLNQNGVPLVKVDLRCEGAPRVHVDQQRLLPVGSAGSTEATWNIPLCFAYGDGAGRHQTCTLLKAKQSDVSLGSRSCPAWLLANSKEVGYYEVAYTDEALRKLVDNRHQLTLAEQVGLFGDVASLAQAGAVPYAQSLSLVPRLAADPAREIVQAAIKLATVPHQYIPIDLQKSYQDFVVQTFGARARQLGWTAKSGEPADDKLLRVALLRFVARRGEDPVLVRNAQELAQKWLRDHRVVGPDVAEILLGTAAEHGGRELFDQFLAAAKAEQDNYYKPILIASLGYFRQPELVSQAFQVATDGTFDVRFTSALMGAQTGERGSSEVVYQYIKNHYDAILRNMPTGIGTEYASYLPQFAAYGGCTAALHDDMEQFFHDRMQKVQGGPRGLAKALESVKLCTAQQPAAQQSLRAFLERGGTKADRSTLVRK
jgi:alanyl aminopeptidase